MLKTLDVDAGYSASKRCESWIKVQTLFTTGGNVWHLLCFLKYMLSSLFAGQAWLRGRFRWYHGLSSSRCMVWKWAESWMVGLVLVDSPFYFFYYLSLKNTDIVCTNLFVQV
jgi:hypothetical protein